MLIDEIGGGTEPQEASALAMGIIDAFVEKGCKIIVTTHLNLLKAYGSTRPFALNVATDFDPRTMKPLYTLLYGVAGVSNALKVAEMCGLPAADRGEELSYLGKQEFVLNDLIRGLETEKKAAEEERRKAAALQGGDAEEAGGPQGDEGRIPEEDGRALPEKGSGARRGA